MSLSYCDNLNILKCVSQGFSRIRQCILVATKIIIVCNKHYIFQYPGELKKSPILVGLIEIMISNICWQCDTPNTQKWGFYNIYKCKTSCPDGKYFNTFMIMFSTFPMLHSKRKSRRRQTGLDLKFWWIMHVDLTTLLALIALQ